MLGFIKIETKHDMLPKFLKMKYFYFVGSKTKDEFDFIKCYSKRLYNMGIIEKYGVRFASFQLQGDEKQWTRAYVDSRS